MTTAGAIRENLTMWFGYTLRTRGIGMSGNRCGNRVKTYRLVRPGAACALALTLVLASARSTPAQDDNPLHTASRLELDVVKVVLAQEKAWNAGDIAGYVKGYKDSPDTLFIGRQVSRGFSQILEDYERNYPNRSSMGTLAFSELEVHSLSDTFAVCLGKYHVERSKKDGGPADGLFSLVLEKTADGWKIVLDHTT
jgi:ketosteroid isomerase-like protein